MIFEVKDNKTLDLSKPTIEELNVLKKQHKSISNEITQRQDASRNKNLDKITSTEINSIIALATKIKKMVQNPIIIKKNIPAQLNVRIIAHNRYGYAKTEPYLQVYNNVAYPLVDMACEAKPKLRGQLQIIKDLMTELRKQIDSIKKVHQVDPLILWQLIDKEMLLH